jgi:hypothetical protein
MHVANFFRHLIRLLYLILTRFYTIGIECDVSFDVGDSCLRIMSIEDCFSPSPWRMMNNLKDELSEREQSRKISYETSVSIKIIYFG